MLPSRQTPDLLAGLWSLVVGQLRAVPRRLVWDNETGHRAGRAAGGRGGGVHRSPGHQDRAVAASDPESKGIVERANGFLETSFLPGRVFSSPADFNEQLAGWLPRANGAAGAKPRRPPGRPDRRRSGRDDPATPDGADGRDTTRVRLPRDYYLRVLGNDYSVDPAAIGGWSTCTPTWTRSAPAARALLVAFHRRSWARHQTITDPCHVAAAARLRGQQFGRTAHPSSVAPVRDLADYDARSGSNFSRDTTGPDESVAGAHQGHRSSRSNTTPRALKAPRIRDSAARLAERPATTAGATRSSWRRAATRSRRPGVPRR